MSYINSLHGSIAALEASIHTVNQASNALNPLAQDAHRLATVVHLTRVFHLVSSSQVETATDILSHQIYPQINALLDKADALLAMAAKRKANLEAKANLNRVRLNEYQQQEQPPAKQQQQQMDRLAALKLKRQRLEYSLNRLLLVAHNKNRQLPTQN